MARRRRRKSSSNSVKIPGATNWKKLCDKLEKDGSVKIKKHLKKANIVQLPPEIKLCDVSSGTVSSHNVGIIENVSKDSKRKRKTKPLTSQISNEISDNITHRLALDCEMVGSGKDGTDNQLARVSIVNVYGDTVYDKIVLPRERVTDYRSFITGLNEEIIATKGVPFKHVQKDVADMIRDKVVIGHDIKHDFEALGFSHPKPLIRDTAKYKPFKALSKGNTPSLKKLCREILKVEIQEGVHNSVEDARSALQLYRQHRTAWERCIKKHRKKALQNKILQDDSRAQDSGDNPLDD